VLRANLKGLHRATLMVGATKLPGAEGPGSDPGRPLADTPLVKEAHFEAEFRKYEADCVKPVCREDEEKVSGENDADRKLCERFRKSFGNGTRTPMEMAQSLWRGSIELCGQLIHQAW